MENKDLWRDELMYPLFPVYLSLKLNIPPFLCGLPRIICRNPQRRD